MATLGQQLTAPETGWRRYDNLDSMIHSVGNCTVYYNSSNYNGSMTMPQGTNLNYVKFKFYGSKFRLIGWLYGNYTTNGICEIDGIVHSFSNYYNNMSTALFQILICDVPNLLLGFHTVKIYSNDTKTASIDAIDIDSDGFLIDNKNRFIINDSNLYKYINTDGDLTEFTNNIVNELNEYQKGSINVNDFMKFNKTQFKVLKLKY